MSASEASFCRGTVLSSSSAISDSYHYCLTTTNDLQLSLETEELTVSNLVKFIISDDKVVQRISRKILQKLITSAVNNKDTGALSFVHEAVENDLIQTVRKAACVSSAELEASLTAEKLDETMQLINMLFLLHVTKSDESHSFYGFCRAAEFISPANVSKEASCLLIYMKIISSITRIYGIVKSGDGTSTDFLPSAEIILDLVYKVFDVYDCLLHMFLKHHMFGHEVLNEVLAIEYASAPFVKVMCDHLSDCEYFPKMLGNHSRHPTVAATICSDEVNGISTLLDVLAR